MTERMRPRTNEDNLISIVRSLITNVQDNSSVSKITRQNEASNSIEGICYIDLRTSSSSENPRQVSNDSSANSNLGEHIMLANYAADDELQRINELS